MKEKKILVHIQTRGLAGQKTRS